MTVDRLAIIEYSLLTAAPILIAWEWTVRPARKSYPFSAIVATISCIWILLALVWRSAIAPDYSNAHACIIIANLLAVLIVAICATVVRPERSLRIVLAALSLAFVWFVSLSTVSAV
jgi:CDP-diglyceride synthetase